MDLKDKLEKFNQRWKVSLVSNPEEEFRKFKIRILDIFRDIDIHVSDEAVSKFCRILGITRKLPEHSYHNPGNIFYALRDESDPIKFYRLLELIFALDIYEQWGDGSRGIEYSKGILYQEVQEALAFSNVNLAVTKNGDEIIFYPRGEEILDEKLVNQVLSFLDKKSNKHFEEALSFYGGKKWIKSAESLRRSLEEFLRFKFKNNSGLATNIIEVGKLLKGTGTPAQARNIITQVFSYLDQYFNENSKHNDGDLLENDAEFLIYQVGLLMRYIHKYVRP